MTAGELEFVVTYFGNEIMIGPVNGEMEAGVKEIDRNSDQMTYVAGLIGQGVLVPAGSTMDDGGKYVFAKFCQTLRELIEKDRN